MPNVTVPGAAGRVATLTYDSAANASTAQSIAAQISAALLAGTERAADNALGAPAALNGLRGLFTQSLNGLTVVPQGYDDIAVPASLAIIYSNTDAGQRVLSGAGSLTFNASGGGGTIVTGGGTSQITISAADTGAWFVKTGGTADTISAGAGLLSVDASGAPAGGAGELIRAGSGTLGFIGGAGNAVIVGGTGSETVSGGAGTLIAHGGTGGHNALIAGTGAASLFGAGNGDFLAASGAAPQALYASLGNETLTGATATGAVSFHAGSGSDLITGGLGANTYVGGTGQATVNAAGSSNTFSFIDGASGGSMLVNDLTNAAQVHISLSGYGPSEAANAVATQVSGAGSVTVTLSDNTSLTFQNITHLTTSNFS